MVVWKYTEVPKMCWKEIFVDGRFRKVENHHRSKHRRVLGFMNTRYERIRKWNLFGLSSRMSKLKSQNSVSMEVSFNYVVLRWSPSDYSVLRLYTRPAYKTILWEHSLGILWCKNCDILLLLDFGDPWCMKLFFQIFQNVHISMFKYFYCSSTHRFNYI